MSSSLSGASACAGRFVLRAWWTRALWEVSSLLKEHDSGSVWLSLSSTHVDQTLHASHSACCTGASANYIIGLAAVCDWILLTHFLTLQRAADSTLQAIHPFWVSRLKVHTSRPAEDYGSLWAGSLSVLQTNSLIRSDASECVILQLQLSYQFSSSVSPNQSSIRLHCSVWTVIETLSAYKAIYLTVAWNNSPKQKGQSRFTLQATNSWNRARAAKLHFYLWTHKKNISIVDSKESVTLLWCNINTHWKAENFSCYENTVKV